MILPSPAVDSSQLVYQVSEDCPCTLTLPVVATDVRPSRTTTPASRGPTSRRKRREQGIRDHGEVEAVRSDSRSNFAGMCFVEVCSRHRVRRGYTTLAISEFKGVAERARTRHHPQGGEFRESARVGFVSGCQFPMGRELWTIATLCACDPVNRRVTTLMPLLALC